MSELAAEVRRHDEAIQRLGLTIWIGAEPTFTRRDSTDACWLHVAEGGDKNEAARTLLFALAPRLARAPALWNVIGRQYPGEETPRFCFGVLFGRNDAPGAPNERPSPGSSAARLSSEPSEPPPVGEGSAWLTVTPDPGVVEVNMAPAHDLATFLAWSSHVYDAAADAGLSPLRYRYNGQITDSGGGGQITLGGPTPETSPFLLHPHLLPGVLRYFNRHPSLSYWFATECVGSASQGPRPDEGVRERYEELAVALDHVAYLTTPPPKTVAPADLWGMLAPLLVDCSGNGHRAEVNVEKLWNENLPNRGCLGLVELRSLRMERTPERMTAIAALLRAIMARLVVAPYLEPLVDHGVQLHGRFALPWFLEEDLRSILADLHAHEVGLGPLLEAMLLEPRAPIAKVELGAATLTISPALEFWPLVGDVASQENAGARIVDASTERVQVLVTVPEGESLGDLSVAGWALPLSELPASDGVVRHIAAVRYRTFEPKPGLHPGLAKTSPVAFDWRRLGDAVSIELHAWIPGGGIYEGLPHDADEAQRRRDARVLVTSSPAPTPVRRALDTSHDIVCLDLRRLPPLETSHV
ncbi:MAG: hypothetical protein JWM74_2934 [Myxococcaceae bacterium]|nr:hypothetical protein [Myxococcaceae bacterium]